MHEGPSFNPPYESSLEELFAINVIKYLDDSVVFQKQVLVETICGQFRIDFVIDTGLKKVAIECDGKEFHDKSRDEWRDAMILGAGAVDVVYHLRGADLTYHLEDCLYIISKWESDIFSKRGIVNLEILATKEARAHEPQQGDTIVMIEYWQESKGIDPLFISIMRNSKKIPHGQRAFWCSMYEFAKKCGDGNLDELIRKYKSQRYM